MGIFFTVTFQHVSKDEKLSLSLSLAIGTTMKTVGVENFQHTIFTIEPCN